MSVIDIDELLKEISPDIPSGTEQSLFDLENLSRPDVDPEGHPISEPKWREVKEKAVDLLEKTHDLRIAAILIRSLMEIHGFSGFRDGLRLIRGFLEEYWETVYPLLDEEDNNDPTERITALWTLADPGGMIDPLKQAPLCASPKIGKFSLRDIHIANGIIKPVTTDEKNPPEMDLIEAVFMDSDKEELREKRLALVAAMEEIQTIDSILVEKVGGSESVPFDELIRILKEIDKVLVEYVGEMTGDPLESDQKTEDLNAENATVDRPINAQRSDTGTITKREDVVRMLDRICAYYKTNEPASPVPLLLRRARKMVDQNFIEILEDVAPESVEQLRKLFDVPQAAMEEEKK